MTRTGFIGRETRGESGTKLAGGFHSATLATFARSLRFLSTQSLPRSIRRFVEPPATLLFRNKAVE
jgi:hypothetical protein